jgi:phosphate transport system substrate-binding protein
VEIATGSLDVRNFDFAQTFFVNRVNPLSRVTLPQLDAAFGTERRLGFPHDVLVWGDLGLTGAWADRPIHLYGWSFDNDFWTLLEARFLGGSHRLNNALHGYAHIPQPDGKILDSGTQILDALAHDPDGLAISNIRYANADTKPLAVGATEAGPYVHASRNSLIDQSYPLTRLIPAVFNRAPGAELSPIVREFLCYLLSHEGQQEIVEDGEYLPLSPVALRAQLRALEAHP